MKADLKGRLRASLLQEAIAGRLVPQDPRDEPASKLLKRIDSKFILQETDQPFPQGWSVVPLSMLCELTDGESVQNRELINLDAKFLRGQREGNKLKSGKLVPAGSLLMLVDGENSGEVFRAPIEGYQGSTFRKLVIDKNMHEEFVLQVINSHRTKLRKNKRGVAIPHLDKKLFREIQVLVPPLAEQKRIVAKIEELMPLVDEYEKAQEEFDNLNAGLKGKLRASLLQEAIAGRLVQQNPSDEPASELLKKIRKEKEKLIKEGKLPKDKNETLIFRGDDRKFYEQKGKTVTCIDDQIPFEIPDNWEWCRLSSLCLSLTDGTHSTPKYTSSGVPFVSVKDMSSGTLDLSNTKYISREDHKILAKRCNPQKGDILLSKVGTTGVPTLVTTEEEFSLFVSVALIKFNSKKIDKNFFVYLLQSPFVQEQATGNTRGVGNKNWVLSAIASTLVLLPPLAEQKRIVEKLESMFAVLDNLDACGD